MREAKKEFWAVMRGEFLVRTPEGILPIFFTRSDARDYAVKCKEKSIAATVQKVRIHRA